MSCKFDKKAVQTDSIQNIYKNSNNVFWCDLLTIEQSSTGKECKIYL